MDPFVFGGVVKGASWLLDPKEEERRFVGCDDDSITLARLPILLTAQSTVQKEPAAPEWMDSSGKYAESRV